MQGSEGSASNQLGWWIGVGVLIAVFVGATLLWLHFHP